MEFAADQMHLLYYLLALSFGIICVIKATYILMRSITIDVTTTEKFYLITTLIASIIFLILTLNS